VVQLHDTIAALATPVGKGAIGVIRISGPDARRIAAAFLGRPGLPPHGRLERAIFVEPDTAASLRPRPGQAILLRPSGYEGRIDHPPSHDASAGLRRPSSIKSDRRSTRRCLDEGMLVCFQAPRSYTGEDLVEMHLHGSPLLLSRVLSLLTEQGARLARPGEFTLRAFLNGKRDLVQAEAANDLVNAPSPEAASMAASRLLASSSAQISALADRLLDLQARLDSELDFPDDVTAMPEPALREELTALHLALDSAAASFERYRIWKEGFRVVIAGAPNVGKSSLFNALLGRNRAIVTAEAGTTRDTLEEMMPDSPVPVLLVDTAGVRQSASPAESAGVARAAEQIEQARLVLLLLDSTRSPGPEDELAMQRAKGKGRSAQWSVRDGSVTSQPWPPDSVERASGQPPSDLTDCRSTRPCLLVATKADLPPGTTQRSTRPCPLVATKADLPSGAAQQPADLAVSSVTMEGVETLRRRIVEFAMAEGDLGDFELVVTTERQRDGIVRAAQAVRRGVDEVGRLPRDILASMLREALAALNDLLGKGPLNEQVLDRIFSTFCIGK
jgi:tRNA modification GTPase